MPRLFAESRRDGAWLPLRVLAPMAALRRVRAGGLVACLAVGIAWPGAADASPAEGPTHLDAVVVCSGIGPVLLPELDFLTAAAAIDGDARTDALLAADLAQRIDFLSERQQSGCPDDDPRLASALERARAARARLEPRWRRALDSDAALAAIVHGCRDADDGEEDFPGACAQRDARLARLAGADGWMQALLTQWAWERGDAAGVERHSRAAAAADAFRSPASGLHVPLLARFGAVPETLANALGDGYGPEVQAEWIVAVFDEHTPDLEAPCADPEADLRRRCIDIARKMLAGASNETEVRRAAATLANLGDADDRAFAAAHLREIEWLRDRTRRFEVAGGDIAGWDEDLAIHGRLEARRRLLERAGIATTPPADWAPGAE